MPFVQRTKRKFGRLRDCVFFLEHVSELLFLPPFEQLYTLESGVSRDSRIVKVQNLLGKGCDVVMSRVTQDVTIAV